MRQLLLVYNADTDFNSRIVDFATKILKPSAYPCSLCMLTFGWFSMYRTWKHYLAERPEEVVELHRDEFNKQFGTRGDLPAIFLNALGELTTVLNADEINQITALKELMERLDKRLDDGIGR